jgi:hypothetical protein
MLPVAIVDVCTRQSGQTRFGPIESIVVGTPACASWACACPRSVRTLLAVRYWQPILSQSEYIVTEQGCNRLPPHLKGPLANAKESQVVVRGTNIEEKNKVKLIIIKTAAAENTDASQVRVRQTRGLQK